MMFKFFKKKTDFKEDLLEFIFDKPLQYVDITEIYKKHYGDAIYFSEEEINKTVKDRLKIAQILNDLKEMGWISFTPNYGFSTGHHRIFPNSTAFEFTLKDKVLVRLSTKGQLEYKKVRRAKWRTSEFYIEKLMENLWLYIISAIGLILLSYLKCNNESKTGQQNVELNKMQQMTPNQQKDSAKRYDTVSPKIENKILTKLDTTKGKKLSKTQ